MTAQPKVSILIPVYNTAQYLPRCMDSVLGQTLKDIEIVTVNATSPDNAAEVLAGYAKQDPRVKVVTHEKNGGILAARLSGIAAATGEFLIFLDADDYLDRDTARACYAKAKSTGADIVHFQFDVRVEHKRKLPFTREVERALAPHKGTLLGKKVFEGAFVDQLYRWNICGKCFAADVCRKGAAALPPGYYIMSEDFCFYSMMSFFATHYEPLFKKCYYYGLEIGVSAYSLVTAKGFERNCSVFTALNAVRSFLTTQGVFEQYKTAFQEQERKIINDLLDRWEHKLIESERSASFSYMCDHYDHGGLIRSFTDYFFGFADNLAAYLGDTEAMKRPPVPVRHIGLYLDSLAHSDFASGMLEAARQWTSAGWKVTVIAGTPGEGGRPALPEGVSLLEMPFPLEGSTRKTLAARIPCWEKFRTENGIDTLVHGAAESSFLLFDLLAVKLSGLNFIAVPRAGFDTLPDSTLGNFLCRTRSLSFADAVAAPGETERECYRTLGNRTTVAAVPAPLPPKKARTEKYILWLGSFGNPPQIHDTVGAWSRIAKDFPDRILLLPGNQNTTGAEHALNDLLELLKLKNSVEFIPRTDNSETLLPEVSAIVLTAEPELFQRILIPASEYGIPILSSAGKLPDALAESLRKILSGDRAESLSFSRPETETVGKTWDSLFRSLPEPRPTPEASAVPARRMLESLFSYRAHFEPYCLPPPARGASFIPFYRVLDSFAARFLPPGTPRRDFFFRAGRYLLKRLPFR